MEKYLEDKLDANIDKALENGGYKDDIRRVVSLTDLDLNLAHLNWSSRSLSYYLKVFYYN